MTILVGTILSDDTLCQGRLENSFVSDPCDCRKYFLCQNEKAISDVCPQVPMETWFDPINQVCTNPGTFCTTSPFFYKTHMFIKGPTSSCGAWQFCLNGKVLHSGVCAYDLTFFEETQACTYPKCSE